MNYHYDRYARRLIEACGYAYDVLRTDIALCRHAYTLFAYTEEQRPSYDADSYERIEAGHIETDWISHFWCSTLIGLAVQFMVIENLVL